MIKRAKKVKRFVTKTWFFWKCVRFSKLFSKDYHEREYMSIYIKGVITREKVKNSLKNSNSVMMSKLKLERHLPPSRVRALRKQRICFCHLYCVFKIL